jgi:cytochrome P450
MFGLFSSAFFADPYPFYARLRESSPVHHDERTGWMVTRYEDIRSLARDGDLSRAKFETDRLAGLSDTVRSAARPMTDGLNREMMRRDPPDHTRLRGLVNRAFTVRMVDQLRPRIRRIVEDLLDAVHTTGRMEVIGDLAYPLPASVIMELLGIPPADRMRVKEWTAERIAFLGGIRTAADPVDLAGRAAQSAEAMNDYFRKIIAERRARPTGGLLSQLVAGEEEDRLTEAEIIANCSLLLSAGHETTTNLIGNGLLSLLRQPDQWRRLVERPDLLPSAIEELLRFDSPVQIAPRATTTEIRIASVSIQPGERVTLMLGAANRDPNQFEAPDRLDIERHPNEHLSFGFDRHFCLGAHLARAEAELAFGVLLQRYPDLAIGAAVLEWFPNPAYRGLKALPVTLGHPR